MRRPGFTLIELLVAAALFISLTSLAAYWIMVGVRAQEFERNAREAQVTARDVLNRLVDEMRTATTLPLASREEHPVPSGVLYPDPYGSTDSPFGGIYRQGVNAVDGHYAENRVIFTRAGTDTSGGAFDPADLAQYVYVEWLAPPNPDAARRGQAWNRIYRKVHGIDPSRSLGHTIDLQTHWGVVANFFTKGNNVRGSKEDDWMVGRLNGAEDILEFRVQHPAYINPIFGQPGKEVSFTGCSAHSHNTYDRNLFNVTVRAITFRRGENNTLRDAKKTETTLRSQVRLESGTY